MYIQMNKYFCTAQFGVYYVVNSNTTLHNIININFLQELYYR